MILSKRIVTIGKYEHIEIDTQMKIYIFGFVGRYQQLMIVTYVLYINMYNPYRHILSSQRR